MAVKISAMIGAGSLRHNNRDFIAENVDAERSQYNITFCNDPIRQVYDELFGAALEQYNAGKKKTRDKIPDYYKHIEKSKQEKLFHEVIFQVGNTDNCHCGTPEGDRAAAVLREFAESFQERNPHLRVFNAVLHMDEATPHLHIDFIPVATEQKRGLVTRVSLKQALNQQGFVGQSKSQTEWNAWVNGGEKPVLEQIAKQHSFEVEHGDGGRKHMSLPDYREAARELEAARQEVQEAKAELTELQDQKSHLQGSVRLLKAVDKVKVDMEAIQPEKGAFGAVRGVTVEQVQQLKAVAVRGVVAERKVKELTAENAKLQKKIPSIHDRMAEARERQRIEQENRDLRVENEYLQAELDRERSFSEKLIDGVQRALVFLEDHLPEQIRPVIEKAWRFIPQPEIQQEQRQEHEHQWGGMEL